MDMKNTKHLDLGCGGCPRNPYGQSELFGIDMGDFITSSNIRSANLAIEKIQFDDDYFDSVSAFDFLEHIPRQAIDFDKKLTRFPFIELMQEIWRVTKPGGRFYAVTPVYPAPEAFQWHEFRLPLGRAHLRKVGTVDRFLGKPRNRRLLLSYRRNSYNLANRA